MHRALTVWRGGESQAVWCRKDAELENRAGDSAKVGGSSQAREGFESLGKETDLCSVGV